MFDVMQLIMVCWDLLGKVDYSCDDSIKSNQGFISQRHRELQLNGNEKAGCLAKMHEVLTSWGTPERAIGFTGIGLEITFLHDIGQVELLDVSTGLTK